jgi:hypothetical protein
VKAEVGECDSPACPGGEECGGGGACGVRGGGLRRQPWKKHFAEVAIAGESLVVGRAGARRPSAHALSPLSYYWNSLSHPSPLPDAHLRVEHG